MRESERVREREGQGVRKGGSYDPVAHSRDSGGQSAHSAVLPIITLERVEDVLQHCQRTLSRFLGFFLSVLTAGDRTFKLIVGKI